MNLSKDTSYVLAMMLDIESLLNLCQANKRFYEWINDENFWKQKMKNDYPFLLEFKKEESWKNFYLEMTIYINKIKEKYDIPYIPTQGYNPKIFFKENYDNGKALYMANVVALFGGHNDISEYIIEKYMEICNRKKYKYSKKRS